MMNDAGPNQAIPRNHENADGEFGQSTAAAMNKAGASDVSVSRIRTRVWVILQVK